MKTIDQAGDLKGKRVLVRLDLNVPIENGAVVDNTRIRRSMPTIDFLRKAGARILIIAHIEAEESTSLHSVVQHMRSFFPIVFVDTFFSEETKQIVKDMTEGEIIVFENLRLDQGEKNNDPLFAKRFVDYADIYVNEAFSVSHRKHASIVGIPNYLPSFAGFLLKQEVDKLSHAFNPHHPFLFILGGAKFETKMPLIEKFVERADTVFVGGALANDFFKFNGWNIGRSLHSDKELNLDPLIKSKKIHIPVDVTVRSADGIVVKKPQDVKDDELISDCGPATVAELKQHIRDSKLVLWNGPFGYYEDGFKGPTIEIAQYIAESGIQAIVGGGDTIAAIKELKVEDKIWFVSTGGGATLDFLANETLPGIEALCGTYGKQKSWISQILKKLKKLIS